MYWNQFRRYSDNSADVRNHINIMMEFSADKIQDYLYSIDNESLLQLFALNTNKSGNQEFIATINQRHGNVSETVLLITFFSLLVVVSVFVNIFVCHTIVKNRKMHTVTNLFIANMAVSDLLMTLLNVPLNIARHLMHEWTLGDGLCHMLNFSLSVSVYISTFTLTAIALDRQRVLIYPLNPRITRRKGFIILAMIWIIAIGLASPFLLYTKVVDLNLFLVSIKRCQTVFPSPSDKWEQYLTIVTILLQYVIPLTIIAVTYGRIVHKLWLRTHLGVVTEKQRILQIQTKRKSIKLLMAVVIVFAVCWMPLNLYHLLTDLHPNVKLFPYNSTVFFICHWIAISSSCINPFLYCWLNPTFREALKAHLRCFKRPISRQSEIEFDDLFSRGNETRMRYRMQFTSMRTCSRTCSLSSGESHRSDYYITSKYVSRDMSS